MNKLLLSFALTTNVLALEPHLQTTEFHNELAKHIPVEFKCESKEGKSFELKVAHYRGTGFSGPGYLEYKKQFYSGGWEATYAGDNTRIHGHTHFSFDKNSFDPIKISLLVSPYFYASGHATIEDEFFFISCDYNYI